MEKHKAGWKKTVRHELGEYLWILSYMALFFCVFATYKMMLTHHFHSAAYEYGTALLNAIVLSKVILIGQYAHVGRSTEHKPLLVSSIYKAFLFAILVAVFHVAEEVVKDFLHGREVSRPVYDALSGDVARALSLPVVVFFVFIPFFALWETRRVMGSEAFDHLFIRRNRSESRLSAEAPAS
jgi:hypothetical protein